MVEIRADATTWKSKARERNVSSGDVVRLWDGEISSGKLVCFWEGEPRAGEEHIGLLIIVAAIANGRLK